MPQCLTSTNGWLKALVSGKGHQADWLTVYLRRDGLSSDIIQAWAWLVDVEEETFVELVFSFFSSSTYHFCFEWFLLGRKDSCISFMEA